MVQYCGRTGRYFHSFPLPIIILTEILACGKEFYSFPLAFREGKDLCSKFLPGSTVWKLRKFILIHFWGKFRESNGFTKEIIKELI